MAFELTRRDEAAMALALLCLRRLSWKGWRTERDRQDSIAVGLADAGVALDLGGAESRRVWEAATRAGDREVIRARLAIYLRTTLRLSKIDGRYPYNDHLRPTAVVTACISGSAPADMRPAGDGWWLHEAITPNMRFREYEWRRWPVPLWNRAPSRAAARARRARCLPA